MENILQFRRQFMLTYNYLPELSNWQHFKIDNYHLYAHPDLEVTVKKDSLVLFILLGYIFDPKSPEKNNKNIISNLFYKIRTYEDLITAIKPYAGRYVIIYKNIKEFVIFNDPLGLREIYYCTQPNKIICGSQPNLLDEYSVPKLGVTKDKNILNFYKHDMKFVRNGRLWVGDETYYQDVKHLMPNHYLDIKTAKTVRYWPNQKLEKIDYDSAVKLSCNYLRGVLKAVTLRYNSMLAVTSGMDSRSLLAASKEIKDKVYYFINKEANLCDNSADIRIPKKMFKNLNIPFHIHKVKKDVDKNFKNIFLNNVFMSTEFILPTIYNVYYKNHSEKLNILGVGEIAGITLVILQKK